MELIIIKSFFIRYLLIPLIVVIMAFVLGYMKKKAGALKNKTLIIYILISALCIAIVGFLGFSGNMFAPYWYLIAMIIYLFMGILNVNMLHKYIKKNNKSQAFSILFESMITLTSMLLGGYLFYHLFNLMSVFDGYGFMATTSIFVYIVPLSFYYTYLQFVNIPLAIYDTWTPVLEEKPVSFENVDFNKLRVLNIELYKNIEDKSRFRIKAKALDSGVSFGDWFFRLVSEYNHRNPNEIIYLIDKDNEPYSWIFYVKKSFFHPRRYIDFEQDIDRNRILENSIVVCKRVMSNEMEKHKN